MDKQKIIKIIFIFLSVMFFFSLLTSSTKKAAQEVSKKAGESVQVFATNRAQMIFNAEVFKSYRVCKKRARKNKDIKNYVAYCDDILNEISVPDEGYLTEISPKYYHYNWLSETFSTKSGRLVYKMGKKDKYLKTGRCLLMFLNKFVVAFGLSLVLSVLFYFALLLLKKLSAILLKTKLSRIISSTLIAIFVLTYFTYKFNTLAGGGGVGSVLLNGDISLSSDVPVILKVMITALAALIVYKEFKVNKYSLWTIGFLVIAFIFNPLIPVIPVLATIGISHFVNLLCEVFFVMYLIKEYKSFNG